MIVVEQGEELDFEDDEILKLEAMGLVYPIGSDGETEEGYFYHVSGEAFDRSGLKDYGPTVAIQEWLHSRL